MAEKESFETLLHSLEEAVERLESGALSLEESLGCFEGGVKSAARCQQLLKEARTRIEVLLQDQQGNLVVEEFREE